MYNKHIEQLLHEITQRGISEPAQPLWRRASCAKSYFPVSRGRNMMSPIMVAAWRPNSAGTPSCCLRQPSVPAGGKLRARRLRQASVSENRGRRARAGLIGEIYRVRRAPSLRFRCLDSLTVCWAAGRFCDDVSNSTLLGRKSISGWVQKACRATITSRCALINRG